MRDEFTQRDSADGFVVVGERREPARLVLTSEGIGPEGKESIPWSRVRLHRDDADGALLVVGRGLVVGSTDREGLERAIEGIAGNDVDRQLAKLRGEKTGITGGQTIGCVVFAVLVTFGIMQVPGCYRSAVDSTVASLDPSVDVQLGEAAQGSMDEGAVIEDEVVVGAIETMVERLEPHFEGTELAPDQFEWVVRVVDDDATINAYALPGGFITVYTGLIEAAETPDMVAGVLAHEMAHVLQRHGLKRMANKAGLLVGLSLLTGDAGGVVALGSTFLDMLLDSGYSRELESEADDLGVKAMARAGLDARSLAEFFDVLRQEYGDLPPLLQWMGSHPDHGTRIEAIDAILEGLPDQAEPEPLALDWEAVRAALGAELTREPR